MAYWTLAIDDWSCHIPLLHVGAHTNTVEGCWKWAKQAMTHAKVYSDEWLYLYLQTYMWRKWRGEPHAFLYTDLVDELGVVIPFTMNVLYFISY